MPCAGITTGEIESGATGTVRTFGIIYGLDTSGFTAHDALYVDSAVAGGLVSSENPPADIQQRVGIVLTSDAAEGQVFVFIDPQMDGHVSYTNRDSFSVFTTGTTPELQMIGSGGATRILATPTGSRVLTAPDATDTLVGKATTDTLTNKTFDTAGAGNSLSINGLAATANTGTGAVVRADSPVFTTEITLPNTGLHILDTNASHDLIIAAGSDLTADRTLSLRTGDADGSLTISGSVSISGSHSGSSSGTNTGDQTITLTGDVTGTGTGSFAATIANDAVTMAKLANIASQTVIGRGDASSGDPSACTLETGITVTTGEVFKASGRFLRQTVYTTGSGTHTPGTDCNEMHVRCYGGGGGGGGADNAGAGQAGAGAGGAAGGKCEKRAANSSTYAYVIPAAAAGGTAGDNDGATGGDVTFTGTNFTLVGKGGVGGAGGASTATVNVNAGGSGVISTGGAINGAGAPGTTGAVILGSSGIAFGGTGGSAEFGRGGTGRVNHGAGTAAIGIGNGGGGGVAITASTPRAGGAGTEGGIIVDEYS
jgi:hypothetical protein